MGKNRKRYFLIKRLKKMNLWLIANILAIFALSLMSIYSSTIPKGPGFFRKSCYGFSLVLSYLWLFHYWTIINI